MQKIYGYRQADLEGLAECVASKKEKSLTQVFEEYATKTGKAKGTVRNLYYALVRACKTDKEFCDKYFNGNPPSVIKPQSFSDKEEDWLLFNVLSQVGKGRSVRSSINQLAGGDLKLALRYQNKYRSLLISKPDKVAKFSTCKREESNVERSLLEIQMQRVKKEINGLVNKISEKIRRENEYLKARNSFLQAENVRLNNLIYGINGTFVN